LKMELMCKKHSTVVKNKNKTENTYNILHCR